MFDTHCHLDCFFSNSYFPPAKDTYFLSVSTQVSNWLPNIKFCSRNSSAFPALGIHPWFVKENFELDLLLLKSLITQYPVTAIGEIGLDFNVNYRKTKTRQLCCFEQQLNIAQNAVLPVSLHCIKAHNEMLSLLKQFSINGVIHGLGSSIQIAQQYVDLGFKLGINGVVIRSNARRYHELVKHFGLAHIVLETDFPNITLPGLVNPALSDIDVVADKVSKLLSVSIDHVIKQTDYNSQNLFKRKST